VKWEKIAQAYPGAEVVITALGTQQDSASCGDFAVAVAKKLQDFRGDVQQMHQKHFAGMVAAECAPTTRSGKTTITNDLGFIEDENPKLLAKLFVHDQSSEHLQEIVEKYDLHNVDLRKNADIAPGSATQNLLSRSDEQGADGRSLYRKRDELIKQVSAKNSADVI